MPFVYYVVKANRSRFLANTRGETVANLMGCSGRFSQCTYVLILGFIGSNMTLPLVYLKSRGGGTQFIMCCQPCILMLKLTPKQVFPSPKKRPFPRFISSESNPFHVFMLSLDYFDCPFCSDEIFTAKALQMKKRDVNLALLRPIVTCACF